MTQTANAPAASKPPAVAPPVATDTTAVGVAASSAPPRAVVARGTYANAAEWWHSLGDVPLERIVTDPWPGTAGEQDLLVFAERDKRLCELIDGTLVEKPLSAYESMIGVRLAAALLVFVQARKLGFVMGADGMNRMASGNIRMPDVTFVSVDDTPNREFPKTPIAMLRPTIAAEVLSPSNTAAEIRLKLREYFQSGTQLAWVLDPETQTIDIYDKTSAKPIRVLVSTDVLDGGTVLPGFQIPVADLFATSL